MTKINRYDEKDNAKLNEKIKLPKLTIGVGILNPRPIDSSLIEKVAEIIYKHQGGLYPEEYENVNGHQQRFWKTDKPWDAQPELELCEWERDEYRLQAKKVLEYLRDI
jgi:hypothetical protein